MAKLIYWGYLLFLTGLIGTPLGAQNLNQIDQTIIDDKHSSYPLKERLEMTPELSDMLHLELAHVRLLLEKKDYVNGFKKLSKLLEKNPDNLELVQMKATAENQVGKWPEAIETIDKAEKNNYEEDDIEELEELRKDILASQEEYVALEGEHRETKGLRKEYFGFFKSRVRLAKFTYVGTDLQQNRLRIDNITRPRTGIIDNSTVYRHQGDIYFEHFFEEGHSIKAGIYGAQRVLGGHAGFTFVDNLGSTTFGVKFRKPDWDNSESVIYEGSRDTVSLGRLLNITPEFQVNVEGGWNNYNSDGLENLVQSFTLLNRFGYTVSEKEGFVFFPGKDSSLGIAYNLEAEYPYHTKNKLNLEGERYSPLSIERTENHGFEFNFSTVLLTSLQIAGFGGYRMTRFTKNNPYAGANLNYTLKEKVKLGFEYEHGIDSSDGSKVMQRFKTSLRYLFN